MSRCSCGKLFQKIKYSDKKCNECFNLDSTCYHCKKQYRKTENYNYGNTFLCSKECLYAYAVIQSPNEFSSVIKDAFDYRCAVCNYSSIVQFHHIKPLSEGGLSTIENCVPLCPNHHAEYHVGLLTKEDIQMYKGFVYHG